MVITVNNDQSIKLALDSKILNKSIHKNNYQLPNIERLLDSISQHLTNNIIDHKYAYSQLQLHKDTEKRCIFKII